ncbi:hypothetical protein POV26_01590 [Aequorivita todarodis]|uniref:hypothetical protein n=1 Tax=Aequorivita todarodis TaxID=2036821 RepID=UPI00234FCD10|nr:hypothetical protein [Aequorivita todarodis]MDC7999718.1 hypothetical protein [Aequorivita todarodis]
MKLSKPLVIIAGIIALGAIVYNFYDNPKVSHLFGKEINDWYYRAFWLLIVGLCVYNYIEIDRNTLKDKSKSKRKQKSKH